MILVTGATGFLGHHLVPLLVRAGYRVRALARPRSDTARLARDAVEIAQVPDITDQATILEACHGCDAIIHAAARFRMWGRLPDFWSTNVQGTAAILEAASQVGVDRFLYVSTIAVVGKTRPGQVVDETHPCTPLDFYQRTKFEAEMLALAYQCNRELPVIILRPGALYGPWGRYAFNRLFFEEPLRGWRIKVNHGRYVTFPAYAADVAKGIIAALEYGRSGAIYNLSGDSCTHNEVNAIVSDLAGINRFRLNVPAPAVLLLARALTTLSRFTGREPFYPLNLAHYVFQDWQVSSARAREELGFRPTTFREGAKRTLDWYQREELL